MQIIAVLNARCKMTDDDREARGAEVAEWWPSGVTAISFVITKPDAADERFVVHAIDAGGEGRGMYSLEVPGDRLPILLGVLGRVIDQIACERSSDTPGDTPGEVPAVSFPVPPPPPPPIHPPPPPVHEQPLPPILVRDFQQVPAPDRYHPAVALATLQQQTILRLQDIQNQPSSP